MIGKEIYKCVCEGNPEFEDWQDGLLVCRKCWRWIQIFANVIKTSSNGGFFIGLSTPYRFITPSKEFLEELEKYRWNVDPEDS